MRVFISYRRSDSRDISAHVATRLAADIGVDQVFIDVAGIEPGSDFRRQIDEALDGADACLVMIGAEWAGRAADGSPRIAAEGDFVRYEVAAALAKEHVRVIPVLLHGTAMPDDLPDDIRALRDLDAVFVRHDSIEQDIEILLDTLFRRRPRSPVARWLRRRPIVHAALRAVGGLAVAGVLLLALAALHASVTGGRALDETLGGGEVQLLIALTLLAGLLWPLWRMRGH